jgi:endonuclease/exonuclease/phosphatase family metal-dependent hydrolase
VAPNPEPSPEVLRVRVATLNVWNTEGPPGRHHLINRLIRDLQPDLLALQEVVHTPETPTLDVLLAGTGLQATHQSALQPAPPPFADRYGGSALATRWPHRPLEALDQRVAGAPDVPWAALAAAVELPGLGEILFIGATGAWRPAAEAARERQALALSDLEARHRRDLPSILAGDFNAPPEAASLRFLTGVQSLEGRSVRYHDAWAVAGEGPGHTWTADNPNAAAGAEQIIGQPRFAARFDYILIGGWDAHPKATAPVQAARLAFDRPTDGIWPSDHFGVVADLEIRRRP